MKSFTIKIDLIDNSDDLDIKEILDIIRMHRSVEDAYIPAGSRVKPHSLAVYNLGFHADNDINEAKQQSLGKMSFPDD